MEHIIAAHTAVTDAVSYSERMKSDRYFVWQDDGGTDLISDNIHSTKAVTGTTDLFTKTPDDPWKEELEEAFDASPYIFWALNSLQYEPETGFYHYEWRWEAI